MIQPGRPQLRSARALLGALLPLAACPSLTARPVSRPSGDEGMLVYQVGRLAFSVPSTWAASGDAARVQLDSPAGDVHVEASVLGRAFAGERECLVDAAAVLARGSSALSNVRRHDTTFAGRRAVTQEADQGPWHGWAWAVCDGGTQYRVWFAGRSPMSPEAVEAHRILVASCRLEGP